MQPKQEEDSDFFPIVRFPQVTKKAEGGTARVTGETVQRKGEKSSVCRASKGRVLERKTRVSITQNVECVQADHRMRSVCFHRLQLQHTFCRAV